MTVFMKINHKKIDRHESLKKIQQKKTIFFLYFYIAFLGTIAVIVFGAKGDSRDWMPDWQNNYLSWSFAFAVIGVFAEYVSGVLFLVESRIQSKRKKMRESQSAYTMETKAWLRTLGERGRQEQEDDADVSTRRTSGSTCAVTRSSGVFVPGPSRITTIAGGYDESDDNGNMRKARRVRIEQVAIRDEAEASTLIVNPGSHMVTTL